MTFHIILVKMILWPLSKAMGGKLTAEPEPQEATEFVADYLLYLLAAASDGASAQFHKTVRARGLRVPEWRVLACLFDRDGAMITHLARIALVEQSRLTRIIAQMEERGLVRRQSDPKDGRRVRVFLTPSGRALKARPRHLRRANRGHGRRLCLSKSRS